MLSKISGQKDSDLSSFDDKPASKSTDSSSRQADRKIINTHLEGRREFSREPSVAEDKNISEINHIE
ncbi:hypothetical protein [Caballeronia calidae]|uniref:hypothetical protein n=1 Tax=Caballeronia calidae TaxID=1777139 RepID=UPI000A976F29|nr:hypothetical protein [Caballeronia calidae]